MCARSGHTVYVAGRDDTVGGRLIALDAVSGAVVRNVAIASNLRPNYMLIGDDATTLYIGADSAPSSPGAFNGVSHVLVYDAATFSLKRNQSLTTPQNAGAGGMALNPCNGWVVLGYEFFRGAQYLPSKHFWDWLDNGERLYLGTGLPAHIGIDKLGLRDGKTEYVRTGLVSG